LTTSFGSLPWQIPLEWYVLSRVVPVPWWKSSGTGAEIVLKVDREKRPAGFLFREVFRMVLDDTGLKASAVAAELQRERSLMYKWLSGSSLPPVSYVPLIAEVVARRCSRTKRLILVDHLKALVRRSDLSAPVRATLLKLDSLEDLLPECLDLSLAPGPGTPTAGPAAATATGAPIAAGSWPWLVLGSLVAALVGGILWNVMNRALGWTYFMGSADGAMPAFPALAWGLVTMAPVIAPLLFLGSRDERPRLALAAGLFTVVGGACAVIFYTTGIRAAIVGRGLGYGLQEMLVAAVYALLLSVPPLAATLPALRGSGRLPRPFRAAVLSLAPAAAVLLGLLATLLVDRPEAEVVQVRGLVVGFALRLTLYVVLAAAFVARPLSPRSSSPTAGAASA
jgi:hypothetical protein